MLANAAYLAGNYVWHHRRRSLLLTTCCATALLLPLVSWLFFRDAQRMMSHRADTTPFVLGPVGSQLDLTIRTLYLRPEVGPTIHFGDVARADGLATAIPLLLGGSAQGFAVVGTTDDYVQLRKLNSGDVSPFDSLGDCIAGAEVARRLGLQPGATVVTDAPAGLDLGLKPRLRLRVVGLLEKTSTADDEVLFVGMKTSWILQGIGHSHEHFEWSHDSSTSVASHGAIAPDASGITEITEDNIDTFHFHGKEQEYPVSAFLFDVPSERNATLLLGRYVDDTRLQLVRPAEVLAKLMDTVFRVKVVFDGLALVLAVVTALLVGLVISLSLKMRERERWTLVRLGASRQMLLAIYGLEVIYILIAAMVLAGVAVGLLSLVSSSLLLRML
ncbi:MAG: hypothetical protein KDA60_09980 [Planctomycetales bacterium]|nr:hypothetical protein [Planctomycetales bacterium]